jgi:hypothetical protein
MILPPRTGPCSPEELAEIAPNFGSRDQHTKLARIFEGLAVVTCPILRAAEHLGHHNRPYLQMAPSATLARPAVADDEESLLPQEKRDYREEKHGVSTKRTTVVCKRVYLVAIHALLVVLLPAKGHLSGGILSTEGQSWCEF